MTTTMTITEIASLIEAADYEYFALRVADGENLRPGDSLRPSRVWDDGNVVTDEDGDAILLPGTCGIILVADWDGLWDASVTRALNLVSLYHGDQMLLIACNDGHQGGEDVGEVILRNAEVVAIIS